MNQLFKTLIFRELEKKGYHKAFYDSKQNAIIPLSEKYPKLEIRKFAVIQNERNQLDDIQFDKLNNILDRVREMVDIWDHSLPMSIPAVSDFRLLSEYKDVVLAARDDGSHGLYFCTWSYNHDYSAVENGHYTSNYEGAKMDFAIRSGLLPSAIFSPNQCEKLYMALLFQGQNDKNLSVDDEENIFSIIEGLEDLYPEFKESESGIESKFEQEVET